MSTAIAPEKQPAEEQLVLYKCTACGGCFKTEQEFLEHARKRHCVVIVCSDEDLDIDETGADLSAALDDLEGTEPTYEEELMSLEGSAFLKEIADHERSLATRDKNQDSDDRQVLSELLDDCDKAELEKVEPEAGVLDVYLVEAVKAEAAALQKDDDGNYSCQWCRKTYTSSRNLLRHTQRQHTRRKFCFCSVCNKAFTSNQSLRNHSNIHANVKPYKCQVCSKAMRYKESLSRHMRWHAGELPYKCGLCGMCFINEQPLRAHEKSHRKIRPFQCEICKKRFTRSVALEKHVATKH